MLDLSPKTNLLEENDYRYSLQDVKDPVLYRDVYEYDEVPRAVIRKISVKDNRLTVEGRLNTYLAEREGFRAYLICGDQVKELTLSFSNATPRFDSRIAYPHFEFCETVELKLNQRVTVVCEYEGFRYTCKLTYSQFCAINGVRNKAKVTVK